MSLTFDVEYIPIFGANEEDDDGDDVEDCASEKTRPFGTERRLKSLEANTKRTRGRSVTGVTRIFVFRTPCG
jgi:hypothetical protein